MFRFSLIMMWRWPFWSRAADRQQLAEESRLRGRVEAERDGLRERLAETQERLARVERQHDVLIAQVLGQAAIAYPTTEPKTPAQPTPLGRAIAALNTREFYRAPSPPPTPAMSTSS